MPTIIQSPDTYLAESRRNKFKEPWPSTAVMFQPARMSLTFSGAGTAGAYVRGVVNEVGAAYFNLTTSANRIPVAPGEVVEYVADTSGTGGYARYLRLYFMRSDGSVLPVTVDGASETAGSWRTQSVAGVAPAEAAFAGVYVLSAATGVGSELYVRKVKAGAVGGYFDGAFPVAGDRSYTWAGLANNSESIEWLRTPVVKIEPLVVNGLSVSREARSIVHTILGSSNPDVTFRSASLRHGTLELIMPSAASAFAAQSALLTLRPFDLIESDVPQANMRFVVPEGGDITVTLDRVARKSWIVEVPFEEIAT